MSAPVSGVVAMYSIERAYYINFVIAGFLFHLLHANGHVDLQTPSITSWPQIQNLRIASGFPYGTRQRRSACAEILAVRVRIEVEEIVGRIGHERLLADVSQC
jgi:hypothetical protein